MLDSSAELCQGDTRTGHPQKTQIGTESFADFRNITFSDCIIRDSRTGVALLAKDGGTIEGVLVRNVTMSTKPKWGAGVEWPVVIDIEQRTPRSKVGRGGGGGKGVA